MSEISKLRKKLKKTNEKVKKRKHWNVHVQQVHVQADDDNKTGGDLA
jgi:hypothetical protein